MCLPTFQQQCGSSGQPMLLRAAVSVAVLFLCRKACNGCLCPALLQAGGKDGWVSVFGSQLLEAGGLGVEDAAPALLSQKLHKGWVSVLGVL